MKISIGIGVVASFSFGAVFAERLSFDERERRLRRNEEFFWNSFVIQDLDSMATTVPSPSPTPNEIISDVPSDGPSLYELSNVPSDGPSLYELSNIPTISGTTSGTTGGSPIPACNSVVEIFCSVPEFSTLCNLIGSAGLIDAFSEDMFTIFAPINDAFDVIPGDVADALLDVVTLRDAIFFHTVPEVKILAENLVCDDDMVMGNFAKTTTLCRDDEIFLFGNGNSPSSLPKVIAPDGMACNGMIHAIDRVMLQSASISVLPTSAPTSTPTTATIETQPPTTPVTCQPILEIVCSLPDFQLLCALVLDADLASTLEGEEKLTVFAPTNEAFESLSEELSIAAVSDSEFLRKVLLSHVTFGEIVSTQLGCGGEVPMVSGEETTTVCIDGRIFQSGAENSLPSLPEIIAPDGIACNGVIHTVDYVILPDLDR